MACIFFSISSGKLDIFMVLHMTRIWDKLEAIWQFILHQSWHGSMALQGLGFRVFKIQSAINRLVQRTLFARFCWWLNNTSTRVIEQIYLGRSRMSNKKTWQAVDTLQKSRGNLKYDRSSISTWRGERKRGMGRVKQTFSSRNEQFILHQRWHFLSLVICNYISDLFQNVF